MRWNGNLNAGDAGRRCRRPGTRWAPAPVLSAARLLGFCYLATQLFLAAASEPGRPAEAAVAIWPAPPAEPRVAFVRHITGPKDLGARTSGWNRFVRALTGGRPELENFSKPFGIVADDAGNLCLTDTGSSAVCYYHAADKRYYFWKKIGPYQFESPVAVAMKDGTFYVADSGLKLVLAFNDKAKPLFVIKQDLQRPAGLALGDGKLFVADAEQHRVLVYSPQGALLSTFGTRGSAPGELNFPTHLAYGGAGHLLVTDSMNCRIQMFDTQGQLLGVIGSRGDSSGHFTRPKGVALDTFGHVYITDAMFDNIQIFDQQGRFLLDVGSTGTGPGEFWLPAGISISRDNQIYVADSYNHRVQVFKYVGKP